MAQITAESLSSAWNAIWTSGGKYDLRAAMESGARNGLAWFRPLSNVSFPATGPVVILNREPWGVVSVDLRNNQISSFRTAENEGFQYADGKFTGKIRFSQLKLSGDYVVHRGAATGSAIKEALAEVSPKAAAGVGDDPNITLAKSYRDQLVQGSATAGSGPTCINTFYQYNNDYAAAFQNSPRFANQWKNWQTANQTTSYYASQTSTAAGDGTSVVNPVVSGSNNYNMHALSMQVFLVSALGATTPAAVAASNFQVNVGNNPNPSTVPQVMTQVNTTPPPAMLSAPRSVLTTVEPNEPEWLAPLRERLRPEVEAIEQEQDDIRRGLIKLESTMAPIPGMYSTTFEADLTITGTVREENGRVVIECASSATATPEAKVQFGAFPGQLHSELQSELDKASFLSQTLGKKVIAAVTSSHLADYVARMMTLAVARPAAVSKS